MSDKFDPYREALVMETSTVWPEELALDPHQQVQLEQRLHETPAEAAHLEYIRTHSGFCRRIYVTDEDFLRVSS